jgi:protein TonB
VVLQQVELAPSVPSPLAMPKLSPDLQLAGRPMIGNIAAGSKLMLDNEAIPLVQIPPIYPTRAEMMHLGGMVLVEFTINGLGRVENPKVIKSQPPKVFDQAAIQAILNWRFKPKLVDGQPVSRLARQRFDFTPRN